MEFIEIKELLSILLNIQENNNNNNKYNQIKGKFCEFR